MNRILWPLLVAGLMGDGVPGPDDRPRDPPPPEPTPDEARRLSTASLDRLSKAADKRARRAAKRVSP